MIKKHYLIIAGSFALATLFSSQAAETAALGKEEKTNWSGLVGEVLFDKDGKKVSVDALNGKYVGIYFSASWCPPCRAFTPVLQSFHEKFNGNFEVVFVGSDRNEQSHFKYMKKYDMHWASVPLNGDISQKLSKQFMVSGIPALILLNLKGEVITTNGRETVMQSQDVLKDKGGSLFVGTEDYLCGQCTKTHQRLVLKAVE